VPEPFAEVCFPAAAAGRADLLPADPVFCGFFLGGWPAGGFRVLLADVAGLAVADGLAAAVGLPVADGLAAVDGLPEVTDLAEVSLLTGAGLAGAAGAEGAVPPVADAAPGTGVGYRLNRTYCWPRVHTLVVTQ
jgi:hypothetical protein